MEQTIIKTKVSQDFLYQYLLEHNFTFSLLSKTMGVSNGIVMGCFRHDLNRLGKPLRFSRTNIEKMNVALSQIADSMRQATITFGSDQTFTNSWGRTYDRAAREAVLALGDYFKLTPLLERVLGWKKGRRDMILVSRNSPVFGQVSREDVNRLNAEILSVAGVLSSYEVVPDETDTTNPDRQDDKPVKATAKHKGMEASFESQPRPWDDTALPLLQRYELFHREHPDGVLFFRVNQGYTVAQDDSRRLCEMVSTLSPYTNPADGMTTTYMDADQFARIMPHCVGIGWRVGITDMYGDKL